MKICANFEQGQIADARFFTRRNWCAELLICLKLLREPYMPRACAYAADELGDDDVHSVREFVRGVGRRGLGEWVGVARGYWHRFLSAAPRPLELPSLVRRYTTARAVHEPPD